MNCNPINRGDVFGSNSPFDTISFSIKRSFTFTINLEKITDRKPNISIHANTEAILYVKEIFYIIKNVGHIAHLPTRLMSLQAVCKGCIRTL